MVTQKTFYVAEDGTQFDSRAAAELYELHAEIEATIDEGYVDGEFCSRTALIALLEKFDLTKKGVQ